jgi:hypothetical protein
LLQPLALPEKSLLPEKYTACPKSGEREPYNAFEHLCSVAFPHDATERVMAFFNAYFDESGTHSPDLITLAGYVATDKQWGEFKREWEEALEKEDVRMKDGVRIFHMSEFENPYGDFTEEKGWTEQRKIDFQSKLIGIINRRANVGIFTSVDLKAYEECMTGWRREHFGTPYAFCVKNCLAQVSLWAQHYNRKEPIAYVIEHGAGYNHEINEAFRKAFADEMKRELLRLGSLSFETKGRAVQLQAADMLAYEVWKDESNFHLNPPETRRARRKSFKKMLELAMSRTFYGKEDFEAIHAREEGQWKIEYPEGVLTFRKPEINAVRISADSSELEELLDELSRFMELSPHLIYPHVDSAASFSKLVSVHTDNVPAADAGDFKVLFKPTDFLLSFITALRASEGQDNVSE